MQAFHHKLDRAAVATRAIMADLRAAWATASAVRLHSARRIAPLPSALDQALVR
jgi:hypothetical protein